MKTSLNQNNPMTYRTKQVMEQEIRDLEKQLTQSQVQNRMNVKRHTKRIEELLLENEALKKKAIVNPLYNRPLDLKERVDREAEVEHTDDMQIVLTGGETVNLLKLEAQRNKQPFSIIKWIKSYLP